ncbi:MAG: class I SAM-dependent methyltransferase [Nanoarchaeota archaeon]
MGKWRRHFEHYDFFRLNSDRYLATLQKHLDLLKGFKYIIDTGAGSGNLTLKLLERGHFVKATDVDEEVLELLKEKCKDYENLLDTETMDLNEKMPLKSNSFDAANSMFVIPFVNHELYFLEIFRILKSNSRFILSAWAPVENTWDGVIIGLERELTRKGILPKNQEEWKEFKLANSKRVAEVKRGPSPQKIIKTLADAGFSNITMPENPYGHLAYTVICEKK